MGERLCKRLDQFSIEYTRLDRSGTVPNGVDFIFDLAGYGNIAGQDEVGEIYKANLMRVIDTLYEAKRLESKYLFISTSSVLLPKQTPYSLSKRAAEEFLRYMVDTCSIKAAIARPYTIIGVGEQKQHLIPRLIDSCLNGTAMPFVSEPVHDFLDVDDFVDALWFIKEKGKFGGEVYDVGSGISYSNEEVLEIVEGLTQKKANVFEVDSLRSYDTKNWKADNGAIRKLGWRQNKLLTQTIAEMIYHERENT